MAPWGGGGTSENRKKEEKIPISAYLNGLWDIKGTLTRYIFAFFVIFKIKSVFL
jgi:predicted translin family RNA/ssDNA-binding protein